MALDRARVVGDISLTTNLDYLVTVRFYDSAQPAVSIWEDERFVVPPSATVPQLQAQVVARGQAIRAAIARRDSARLSIPADTVVTIT